jgi:RimJ/RimL family protein N-acetyltransferase
MSWKEIAAAVLENERVLLRPLSADDRASIHSIAMDPEIWRYFVTRIGTEAEFDTFFDGTLAEHEDGRRAVYHITDKRSGRVAGSMSFGNMDERDLRIEIGWSWLSREFQGHGVNRWAKYLLMGHAFEQMHAERVQFRTDVLNEQARRALRNIGAAQEGVLRSFNVMPGGRRRDAVFYSVLRNEWPQVKQRLSARSEASAGG